VNSIFDICGDLEKSSLHKSNLLIDDNKDYETNYEIVIPTFKRPKLLLEALDSALNQNYNHDYKITIIDNDPSDDNPNYENLIKYKGLIKYYRNEKNIGSGNNWNKALELSSAKWVCLLADDDLLATDYLKNIDNVLNNFEPGLITHIPKIINDDGIIFNPYKRKFDYYKNYIYYMLIRNKVQKIQWEAYLLGNKTSACAMLINRKKAISLGGWNLTETASGDWFFNSRMAYNYEVLRINKPISFYRVGQLNDSFKKSTQLNLFIQDLLYLITNYNLLNRKMKLIFWLPIKYVITKRFKNFDFEMMNKDDNQRVKITIDGFRNHIIKNIPLYLLGMMFYTFLTIVLIRTKKPLFHNTLSNYS
jgi:glycosyltransferase involved in cell wall biosynthesis